jgi:hypothetical protein
VALRHRVLLALVAIALVCERVLTLSAAVDPRLRAFWAEHVQRVAETGLQAGPAAVAEALQGLTWPLLPVALLFLTGMLLLVGVVTLIRDLLLHGHYRSRGVLRQGGHYFWPVLRYKLPVYMAGSVFSLIIAAALWELHSRSAPRPVLAAAVLALLWLAGFAVARVFLSLGTKVIVSEAPIATAAVFRRVLRIVRPHLGTVVIFYLLLLALTAAAMLAVWGLASLPAPPALRAAVAVALLAAVTLVMKAAAFDLYLQLAGRSRPSTPVADRAGTR